MRVSVYLFLLAASVHARGRLPVLVSDEGACTWAFTCIISGERACALTFTCIVSGECACALAFTW